MIPDTTLFLWGSLLSEIFVRICCYFDIDVAEANDVPALFEGDNRVNPASAQSKEDLRFSKI